MQSITTFFFYEELKPLVGTSQSYKWLAMEKKRLEDPNTAACACHSVLHSQLVTFRALEKGERHDRRHHDDSTTQENLKHTILNAFGCVTTGRTTTKDRSHDSCTEKSKHGIDDMWLLFTDAAYLAETE